jgi:hypothetical protein
MLFKTQAGKSFQANEMGILIIDKVRTNCDKANIEEFILSEFDIDRETMDEHLEELLLYLMHNHLIDTMPHN